MILSVSKMTDSGNLLNLVLGVNSTCFVLCKPNKGFQYACIYLVLLFCLLVVAL